MNVCEATNSKCNVKEILEENIFLKINLTKSGALGCFCVLFVAVGKQTLFKDEYYQSFSDKVVLQNCDSMGLSPFPVSSPVGKTNHKKFRNHYVVKVTNISWIGAESSFFFFNHLFKIQ